MTLPMKKLKPFAEEWDQRSEFPVETIKVI